MRHTRDLLGKQTNDSGWVVKARACCRRDDHNIDILLMIEMRITKGDMVRHTHKNIIKAHVFDALRTSNRIINYKLFPMNIYERYLRQNIRWVGVVCQFQNSRMQEDWENLKDFIVHFFF